MAAARPLGSGPSDQKPALNTLKWLPFEGSHALPRWFAASKARRLPARLSAAEQGFAGAPLPDFVRDELEGYVHCGLLQRGFALVACKCCQERHLVAFSCHTRSFCPSCTGRRMTATTLNLLEHVVPAVGLRQFVLTVPHALRARLAYDGRLLGAVSRIFVDSVLGWYRRRMEIEGASRGQSGAVTVVQRVSADLKLNDRA